MVANGITVTLVSRIQEANEGYLENTSKLASRTGRCPGLLASVYNILVLIC